MSLIENQCIGRNSHEKPDRRVCYPGLRYVRNLRGRLHRDVRNRQVRLSRT